MKTDHKIIRNVLFAGIATAGLASFSAQAYGPLYVFDYESGTPWRWDVTEPVDVWVDGGNFASGTVRLRNPDLPTCNAEGGWQCYEEIYVEFTNEQGKARVDDALASWSAVPTSSFQAAVAGSFADIGIGGEDGDITGAPEEFFEGEGGEVLHEIIGSVNNGGIHVLFDEDGSVMANVMGAPYGVLGIASPEWGDETTGIITEGWVVIGGGQTYYNDADLVQMGGVITHELGHSFNLAHTQTNGQVVMYGNFGVVTTGPVDCSAHWYVGGEYQLPYPQSTTPTPENMAVMYPYIDHNPGSWSGPTGEHQATASTVEDYAAISSVYPAASFASETGTITGTVTYPFSRDGIIGVNVVARNIDNPFEDAVTAMAGDWNDGVPGAAQGMGEYILQGLTPEARYVIHVENIFAGGFPTPQVKLPGPSEYWNGSRENDDASRDNACDYEEIVVDAGMIQSGYGVTSSWLHHAGTEDYTILPMGSITLSDNGSVIGAEMIEDNVVYPARMMPGKEIEILPPAGNSGCDQGSGVLEYYSHFAISPDGNTMGGFLWHCDGVEGLKNFTVSAVTYDDANGWRVLNDHLDSLSARVNAVSNNQVAVGWSVRPNSGWWEGRVWVDGQEINMQDAAPANIMDIGEVTGVSSDGSMAVGINSWDDAWNQRGYTYNVESGELTILDIAEECPWWDWFCFGAKPFNPYDIADDGTMVGAIGTASGAGATLVNDLLGTQKLTDFLRGQGVINATDLEIASTATKISSNGRHIVGWTAVDGYFGSFKLTLDQLWVCRKGKSMQVGYPGGVASQLENGATLGMCEEDLPLQYKGNY